MAPNHVMTFDRGHGQPNVLKAREIVSRASHPLLPRIAFSKQELLDLRGQPKPEKRERGCPGVDNKSGTPAGGVDNKTGTAAGLVLTIKRERAPGVVLTIKRERLLGWC